MPNNNEIIISKTTQKIIENYNNLEKSLVSQLLLETPAHPPTTGGYREAVWKGLFEQIIPRKFCIDQGIFIIDSDGRISDEVDLVIFDEQYTPYIFNYGKIKFIPVEAVAVVIQCKSRKLNYKGLYSWVESIEKLKTSMYSVARIISGLIDNYADIRLEKPKSQTSTRPIRILCTTADSIPERISHLFDISLNIISVNKDDKKLKKTMPGEEKSYEDWYVELNHYDLERFGSESELYSKRIKHSDHPIDKKLNRLKIAGPDNQENVILSLIFQLNQMLMFINNPMLFPHEAYAELFRAHMTAEPGQRQ